MSGKAMARAFDDAVLLAQDCAVRCEPPLQPEGDLSSPGIAAALLLGAGQWASTPPAAGAPPQQAVAHPLAPAAADAASSSQALQPVVLQSLSLWVAPADGGYPHQCGRHPCQRPACHSLPSNPRAQCSLCI